MHGARVLHIRSTLLRAAVLKYTSTTCSTTTYMHMHTRTTSSTVYSNICAGERTTCTLYTLGTSACRRAACTKHRKRGAKPDDAHSYYYRSLVPSKANSATSSSSSGLQSTTSAATTLSSLATCRRASLIEKSPFLIRARIRPALRRSCWRFLSSVTFSNVVSVCPDFSSDSNSQRVSTFRMGLENPWRFSTALL